MGLFIISIIIIILGLVIAYSKGAGGQIMEGFGINKEFGKFAGLAGVIIGLFILIYSFLFTVDEGEAVVLVQFGKLYSTIDSPGVHAKRPWATIHAYPKRIREHTTVIEVRTEDGMSVRIDTTTWYKVDTGSIDRIYKEIAADVTALAENIIFPALRTTIRNTVSQYTVKQLYVERTDISKKIFEDAKMELAKKYVLLDNVMLRDIKLPENIESAVQMKIKAQQDAEAAEYKKLKAIKDAEIKVEEAKGIAQAQSIINRTLTPNYLQHEAIAAYKELVNSKNTTFVIMPTNPKATGMPLILNSK
ncbi:MAG: prohibitin family protein [Spirochaetota bacterium]|nr:prohibitin family protein [Spirochaetota bacterium]